MIFVKILEHVFEIFFVLGDWTLQAAGYEFVIVNHPVLVSIDWIHNRFEFYQTCILLLLLQSLLQFIYSQKTIWVSVDLFKKHSQLMNLFFRDLARNISHWKSFELTYVKITFENLENCFNFLKSIGRAFWLTFPAFIHGWFEICSKVILWSLGSKIFLIKSFSSGLRPWASSSESYSLIYLSRSSSFWQHFP